MNLRFVFRVVAATGFLLSASGQSQASEYLVNGGFESGGFGGWTEGSSFNDDNLVTTGSGAYQTPDTGVYLWFNGNPGKSSLSQSFADTPGQDLTFSGAYAANGTSQEINISFDGQILVALSRPDTAAAWVHFSFDVTATGNDTVEIESEAGGAQAFDSFSVTDQVQTTPLPAALPLFASGLGSLGLLGWRRKRKVAALAA